MSNQSNRPPDKAGHINNVRPGEAVSADDLLREMFPKMHIAKRLQSKLANQLADTRLHLTKLNECLAALSHLQPSLKRPLFDAAVDGIATKYFSCFSSSPAASRLSEDLIFKGRPDAKAAFIHWKDIRDKHIAHDSGELGDVATVIILGREEEYLNIATLRAEIPLRLQDRVDLLRDLVKFTAERVDARYQELEPMVQQEAAAMTQSEIAALGPFTMRMPSVDERLAVRKR